MESIITTSKAFMENLITERKTLAEAMANDYDSDAFPGSRTWHKGNRAMIALANFDKKHPEVIAYIQRAAIDRTLAGVDVLGI